LPGIALVCGTKTEQGKPKSNVNSRRRRGAHCSARIRSPSLDAFHQYVGALREHRHCRHPSTGRRQPRAPPSAMCSAGFATSPADSPFRERADSSPIRWPCRYAYDVLAHVRSRCVRLELIYPSRDAPRRRVESLPVKELLAIHLDPELEEFFEH
jgi:hypothetical protein